MTHNPCHARRAMASKARPWLGKGTHSAIVLFLRRMGSLSLAMLSFASHCEAGNDAVVVYQPTMIPGTRFAFGKLWLSRLACTHSGSDAERTTGMPRLSGDDLVTSPHAQPGEISCSPHRGGAPSVSRLQCGGDICPSDRDHRRCR